MEDLFIMQFDHFSITPPNPIFISIAGTSIHWYAILIMTGVALAVLASRREGKKKGFDPELFMDLLLVGLPLSILGARLYFVLFNNLAWYLANPSRILAIRDGGLAIHGAVIAAGVYAWWILKKKNIPILPILDIVAVGFFIGQIIGRFGNFMNQEAHGHAINLPTLDAQREFLTNLLIPNFIVNGMFINGNYYHPTFLYEALWNVVGLCLAVFILRRLKNILTGEIAAFYAIWYSFGRIFIESMRTDSLMLGSLRIAQVISITSIIIIGGLMIYRRIKKIEIITYADFNIDAYNRLKKQNKTKKKNLNKR